MTYEWNADTVRFLRDASEFSPGYYETLADAVAPYLPADATVLDAGCGLGYLSLALAGHAASVTAADVSPRALSVLEANRASRGSANIVTVCKDVFSWRPARPFDAAVFCYCGTAEEILSCTDTLCCGPVAVIKRNYTAHRFSVGTIQSGREDFSRARELLAQRGVPFDAFTLETEFGQPFRSLSDARRFFVLFAQDADKSVFTDGFLKERLTETGREDFPLYLPSKKDIGVLVLWPDRR